MPGTISQYQVVIPGQVITATLWNGMELNIINNGLIWSGIDDYSATDSEMQITTDPFPGGVISRPTSAQGELERVRFQIKNILGESQWYNDPDATIASIATSLTTLQTNIDAVIPSGTKMPFYQASVPTGWTAVAVNDKFMRVVTGGGTGGTTGGSGSTPASGSSFAHSHTVNSHTHDLGNHTHTGPSHTHTVPYSGWGGGSGTPAAGNIRLSDGSTSAYYATADNTSGASGTGATGAPSTNTSSAATPGTDSQLGTISFQYADFCVGTKD